MLQPRHPSLGSSRPPFGEERASTDLVRGRRLRTMARAAAGLGETFGIGGLSPGRAGAAGPSVSPARPPTNSKQDFLLFTGVVAEIDKASCGERGFEYVYISV